MKILVLLLVLTISGCSQTIEISSGSYGPFSIGATKQETLLKIEGMVSITSIEPITLDNIYVDGPTKQSVHALDNSNGILVCLDNNPFPLRIEFIGNVVVNKWGANAKCIASNSRMNIACSEIIRLNSKIQIGSNRDEIYKVIIAYDTKLTKQIGNFVVGYQEFRVGKERASQDYRNFILSNDAWEFDGLKELSKYNNPFESRVTLYFKEGRLSKIKHWSEKYEML